MQPDIPTPPPPPVSAVSAVNPDTGQPVTVEIPHNLNEAIQQAIKGAMSESRAAVSGAVTDSKAAVHQAVARTKADAAAAHPVGAAAVTQYGPALEERFQSGPVTKRTFWQGLAVDLSFAGMAVLAAASADSNFNLFDKEALTLVGVMLVKTVVQTGLSYVTKAKAEQTAAPEVTQP